VLTWARGGTIDLPDRLPFEAMHRLYDHGPRPEVHHHLGPVTVVMSSKKSGTSRPFARLDAVDLTLYQALVDKLAPEIEAALPARDRVFAYRQTVGAEDHAFHGTPSRGDYETRIQAMLPRVLGI
jgi:hypothetical protein